MEVVTSSYDYAASELDSRISVGIRFLSALFAESDIVLFRPIESWVEADKKRSRVDYKHTFYRKAVPALVQVTLLQLLKVAQQERLNLFFGVCPRIGGKGRFDLAWQIRTVRALWTDIDHITVEQALERVAKADLPPPSIIVNSGHGAHLYWLLDAPYLIDDAGDPPPVETEWIKTPDGRKEPRKYLVETCEKVYLDQRGHVSRLSAKAGHIQDVLAGIADAVGGDHTADLSRLLRLPGTLNRKNERNCSEPVPTELVECDPTRRYSLAHFEQLKSASPETELAKQIAVMPLPKPRKISRSKSDKLAELAAACAIAPAGSRSEADFSLCCFAIRNGFAKEEVWAQVQQVGKFAEAGRCYFDRTWGKAEDQVREQHLQRAVDGPRKRRKKRGGQQTGDDEGSGSDPGLVATLAHLICEGEHFAQDDGGKLYRYQGGVYRPRAEAYVRARVKNLCEKMDRLAEWSSHVANEVVEFIRVDSSLLWQQPPCDVLNVKNGILNLTTKRLEKHSPDHLSALQLPVKFDPTATCPKIDRFIRETFPEDATTIGYEIPAWLMTPDTSIQKAVLLIGPGGNGKSRYLRMVEAFLGKTSVSNLSLHRLESDKFACARLYGRLANICPDLPTEHLAGTSIFKAITGGDPITGEYKFKDSFDFVPFARLVFSANSPPRAHDASEGFFDRWLVIPLERRFRGEGGEIPADKLDAMLSEPGELSGLLNRALELLPRLRAAGRFSTSESVARAFSEFHAATDPLTVWLDSQTIEGPRALITKRALISAFNEHYERNGRSPMSEKAFGAAIKRLRPDVTDAQRTVSDKVQWCYVGIGLKSDASNGSDDFTDPPGDTSPKDSSRDSRDSRDSPSINLSHAREGAMAVRVDVSAVEQDSGNRVNRVNAVNGACAHEYVDELEGSRIRTSCRRCGQFRGYRPRDEQRYPSKLDPCN